MINGDYYTCKLELTLKLLVTLQQSATGKMQTIVNTQNDNYYQKKTGKLFNSRLVCGMQVSCHNYHRFHLIFQAPIRANSSDSTDNKHFSSASHFHPLNLSHYYMQGPN